MCRHCYHYPGHRTWGGDIPGYAQGAYFPGDEPGERCRLTDDYCDQETCPEREREEEQE